MPTSLPVILSKSKGFSLLILSFALGFALAAKRASTIAALPVIAAEQGYAIAQYNLGVMYDKGPGVPEDDKTAVKWFRNSVQFK